MSMIMPYLTFCQQVTKSHKPADLPVGRKTDGFTRRSIKKEEIDSVNKFQFGQIALDRLDRFGVDLFCPYALVAAGE